MYTCTHYTHSRDWKKQEQMTDEARAGSLVTNQLSLPTKSRHTKKETRHTKKETLAGSIFKTKVWRVITQGRTFKTQAWRFKK